MEILNNIEVVKKPGACVNCLLHKHFDSRGKCSDFFLDLTNKKCWWKLSSCGAGFMIRKKAVWKTCTKENTSVYGKVKQKGGDGSLYKVKYIFNYPSPEFILSLNGGDLRSGASLMSKYEIEIKE